MSSFLATIIAIGLMTVSPIWGCKDAGISVKLRKKTHAEVALTPITKIIGTTPEAIFNGGGTLLNIRFENYDPKHTIKFNGLSVSNVKVTSDNEIEVSTPKLEEGPVELTVENGVEVVSSFTLTSSRSAFSRLVNFTGGMNLQATADGAPSIARVFQPTGVAYNNGRVYFNQVDNILRVLELSTGNVTTLAGKSGPNGFADGVGSAARFANPHGMVIVGSSIYLADQDNNAIRVINFITKEVSTLVGGTAAGSIDGPLSTATLDRPSGMVVVGNSIYLTSLDNTIRKIDLNTNTVSTYAGTANSTGTTDATGITARFNAPYDITHANGFLFVCDYSNQTVRKIDLATAAVTTFAGAAGVSGNLDGIGAAARFNGPIGISTDGTYLWLSDLGSITIKRITISDQTVTTVAGSYATRNLQLDATGTAAGFYNTRYIAVAGGQLYIADAGNGAIRRMNAASLEVTTAAGKPNGHMTVNGSAAQTTFREGRAIVHDDNYFYVADHLGQVIHRIDRKTGVSEVLAGKVGEFAQVDGNATDARFIYPWGLAIKGTDLYSSDFYGGKIRKISTIDGTTSTLANTVTYPAMMSIHNNTLYVCQFLSQTIHKVDLATGIYSLYAGALSTSGHVDGDVLTARFAVPMGCLVVGDRLFVSESSNRTIRAIDLQTNIVSTFAGVAAYSGTRTILDGPASQAKFYNPSTLATDGLNLYVGDHHGFVIRKIPLNVNNPNVSTIAGQLLAPGTSLDPLKPSLSTIGGLDYVFGEGLFIGSNTATFFLK